MVLRVLIRRRRPIVAGRSRRLGVLALLLASASVLSGCAGRCGSNCPVLDVDLFAAPGENLNVSSAQWTGPACPPGLPTCRGDLYNPAQLPCIRFTMLASAPGACQLDVTFTDRPPVTVSATFGPETTQGCCHGFPVIGTAVFNVPPYGSTQNDAGAGGDADAASSTDGPTDAAGGADLGSNDAD
jgi:hypothetical protein